MYNVHAPRAEKMNSEILMDQLKQLTPSKEEASMQYKGY